MKALYIVWQDWETRAWHTIGKLTKEEAGYYFNYTKGALVSPRFIPFGRMFDLNKTYYSLELFPLFANRILNVSRPEYKNYLHWLALDTNETENNDMELLARSSGKRATDELYVYPHPEVNAQGQIELFFLSHGLRHLTNEQLEQVNNLKEGDKLLLVRELNNNYDSFALMLQTNEQIKVGYCPRYLNQDLIKVMAKTTIDIVVARLNHNAPIQFRLLCHVIFTLPINFNLFDTEEHQILSDTNKIAA